MINAIASQFPDAQRQRCVVHKMENVLGYIPTHQQDAVKPELKAIFYQASRREADIELAAFCDKYANIYPSAIDCLRRDLDATLAFYAFPKHHWRAIRTTNLIERMFGEAKKRSKKMAAPFRNETSCLLLFFAVVRTIRFQRIRVA
jgi:transposase-like protein